VHLAQHIAETMRFVARQTMDLDNGRGIIILTNATNQLPSGDEPFTTFSLGLLDRLESWPRTTSGPSLHQEYAVLDLVWRRFLSPSRGPLFVCVARLHRRAQEVGHAAGSGLALEIAILIVVLSAVSATGRCVLSHIRGHRA